MSLPGWVNRFKPQLRDRGADLGVVLGCAHFGCVFPVRGDDRWVIKITRDPTEAPMWRWIHDHQKSGEYGLDAFAFTKGVWNVGKVKWRGKEYPVTIIQREAVDPADREKNRASGVFVDGVSGRVTRESGNVHLMRSLKGLHAAQQASRDFHRLKTRHRKSAALDKYMRATGEIQTAMPYIADAMAHLTGRGVVFADLHHNNVGKSVVNWGEDVRPPGTWIVFDPGDTPILEPDEVWE